MDELPPGWAEIELGALTTKIGSGATPRGGSNVYHRSGIPLIRSMNVHFSGFKSEGLVFLDAVQASNLDGVTVQTGDVLLNITGASIGRVALAPHSVNGARVNQHVCIIRTTQSLIPDYLVFYLASPDLQAWINGEHYGMTRPALTRQMLTALRVPVPPLAEQRRIVARIEALFARTRRARAELERVAALTAHYRGQVLATETDGQAPDTWREVCVADVAQVVTGATPPGGDASSFGSELPFVKPTDLEAGYHVKTARETLSAFGKSHVRPVPAESTLVTCIGATIGKTGFARVECATNQQINALVPRRSFMEPRWLYWLTISPAFQNHIIENSSATTLPIINKGRFEQLRFKLPPLADQTASVGRIEKRFASAQETKAEATRALALLDRLDAAILARAFRGELVPQDPADEPARLPFLPTAPRPRRSRAAQLPAASP